MKKFFVLIFLLYIIPLSAAGHDVLIKDSSLSPGRQICIKAQNDANIYHGHRELDFVFGFFAGPFAVINYLMIDYQITEKTIILSENEKYFSDPIYIECYTKRAKRNRLVSILWGWLSSTIVICFFTVVFHYMD